jgi:hypothetical protein
MYLIAQQEGFVSSVYSANVIARIRRGGRVSGSDA